MPDQAYFQPGPLRPCTSAGAGRLHGHFGGTVPSLPKVAYAQGMDWFFVVLIAVVGIVVLFWAARAGRTGGSSLSDADRYQLELARKAQAQLQATARSAAAGRPSHPSQRTGYSQANAYRTSPAQGQNETHGQNTARGQNESHGQNLTGRNGGQNGGRFSGQDLPMSMDPQLIAQLQSLIRSGSKMQAIALLRSKTGVGLMDAKNYVDRLG